MLCTGARSLNYLQELDDKIGYQDRSPNNDYRFPLKFATTQRGSKAHSHHAMGHPDGIYVMEVVRVPRRVPRTGEVATGSI